MGMFDYVDDLVIKCPNCGAKITGFQSKEGECLCRSISFTAVDYCYSSCEKCNSWIEVYIKKPKPNKVKDYTIKTLMQDKSYINNPLTDYIIKKKVKK